MEAKGNEPLLLRVVLTHIGVDIGNAETEGYDFKTVYGCLCLGETVLFQLRNLEAELNYLKIYK